MDYHTRKLVQLALSLLLGLYLSLLAGTASAVPFTKGVKKVENATAVIWKTLRVAEQSFRRLDAPELLPEVAEGVAYVNGERAKRGNEEAAA